MGTSGEKAHSQSESDVSHDKPAGRANQVSDTSPSTADPDAKLQAAALLLPHLDSFVKWELLRFLHDNPNMAATVEELARYTGRDETELKPAARALAGAGILEQREIDSDCAYSLTADDTLRHLISHLIQGYLADRLVRLAISNQILRAQRRSWTAQFAAQ